jgi:hypothetical protein
MARGLHESVLFPSTCYILLDMSKLFFTMIITVIHGYNTGLDVTLIVLLVAIPNDLRITLMHDRDCILSRSKSSFAIATFFKDSSKFFSNISLQG